jgi:hypothetical protein
MTIEEKTAELRAWATGATGGEVVTGPPSSASQETRVSLYLLDLLPETRERNSRQRRLQATVRYLVTVATERPEEQHRILGELLFAAMDSSLLEIESAPQPVDLWRAFGVSPQAALVIRAKVWKEVPERLHPRVREAKFYLEPIHTGKP